MCKSIGWRARKTGYAELGNGKEALQLFEQMRWVGMKPDSITVCGVLKAFSTLESLPRGKEVHAHMVKLGFVSNIFVESSLVGMYSKCGSIGDARCMFDEMTEQNVVSWTTMIAAYAEAGDGEEALIVFIELQRAGTKPDQITFASVLSACTYPELCEIGKQIHALFMKSGYESDASVQCAFVTMYAKCTNIKDARKVFDRMSSTRDVVLWTTMLSGYAHNECGVEALTLFCQMLRTCMRLDHVTVVSFLRTCASLPAIGPGKQVHACIIKIGLEFDVSVGTALLTMYANCQNINDAWKVFNKMALRDAISWSAMIAGYVQQGHNEEAWRLLCQMQCIGMKPNQFTFSSVLMACANLASFEQGKLIHARIIKTGCVLDVFVGSALVDMYAKCGSIDYAKGVFHKIVKADVVLWNAMIAGYSHHGYYNEALRLFEQMQEAGMKPDHITFISVLSACSRAGLMHEGFYYFSSMNHAHGITPKMEHYACMVDLLGRAGLLEEAVNFINGMPFKPGTVVLHALLGACKIYANIDLGKLTAERLLELEPNDTATYVLLSNIYAAAGSWDDAVKVRKLMKDRGLAKEPGCSWIEVNHTMQVFVVGDRSHPQIEDIHVKLEKLIEQIKEAGYVPNTNFALHDVEEEQKEHSLHHHSEKVAIAFALINTPPGAPITVIKNLRVCGDCHTAIKFISKIVGREIIVRDANHFHHLKDGLCSCRDYW